MAFGLVEQEAADHRARTTLRSHIRDVIKVERLTAPRPRIAR